MPGVRVKGIRACKQARVDKVRGVTEPDDLADGPFDGLPGVAFLKFDLQHRLELRDGGTRAAENLRFSALDIDLYETHIPKGAGIERTRGYAHRTVKASGLPGIQEATRTGKPAAALRQEKVRLAVPVGQRDRMGCHVAGMSRNLIHSLTENGGEKEDVSVMPPMPAALGAR